MYQLILLVHVLVAVVLIGLILIQQGKGADIGAAFGSGASNTVFGSQGVGTFLFKFTSSLAIIFFATSLLLSYLVSVQHEKALEASMPHQIVPNNKVVIPVEAPPSLP